MCSYHLQSAALVLPMMEAVDTRPSVALRIYGLADASAPRECFDSSDFSCSVELHMNASTTILPAPLLTVKWGAAQDDWRSRWFIAECAAEESALEIYRQRSLRPRALARLTDGRTNSSYVARLDALESRRSKRCRVRVCTKAYGNGGIVSDPAYLAWWLGELQSIGVAEVALYSLDQHPPPSVLEHVRAAHPGDLLALRRWPPRVPYSAVDYQRQSEVASSEIEANYRSAMGHCVADAIGDFDWVTIIDTDELLVLAEGRTATPNRNGQRVGGPHPLCAALLTPPPPGRLALSAFRLPCTPSANGSFVIGAPQQHDVDIARRAATDPQARARLKEAHFELTGWKAMWRPSLRTANSPGAHGPQHRIEDPVSNLLVPAEVAYLAHCTGKSRMGTRKKHP